MKGAIFMQLRAIRGQFTVCKVQSLSDVNLQSEFLFLGKTDQELSLVCKTADAPAQTAAREDGWCAFRIEGTLDFSLTGILAGISSLLAGSHIGIFAVSTFNTDYILVKEENFVPALSVLAEAGYEILR